MDQASDSPSWDDLRIALAVAREGSVRRAARALGVSHSTVLRRVGSLERSTGAAVFERLPTGWELTTAGQDVLESAQALEEIVTAMQRRVEGHDQRLVGPVRLTLPDAMLPVLADDLAQLARTLPEIALHVHVSTSFARLEQREADLAIRIAPDPPADLVGRRIGMLSAGVWGTERYLRDRPSHALADLDWVGWVPEATMGFARWLDRRVPQAHVAMRVDTAWALREAIDAHAGVGLVPCALGIARGWRRVCAVPDLSAPMWVLTHADLRTKARVRVCRDRVIEMLLARRTQLEGSLQT